MATTDVLRPISVRETGSGTSVPSGTLSAVTSDNSDATYIAFNNVDAGHWWSLRVGPHTPAADYQRHRVRARVRIKTDAGTANEYIDLGRGSENYIGYDSIAVTSSFQDLPGSWYQDADYGLATVGALTDLNIGGGYPYAAAGGSTQLRTAECYIDIDCRHEPSYAPQVQDAAGVDRSSGTVTDTNQPTLFIGGVNYDGLPANHWAVAVYNDIGPTLEFFQEGSGTPPTSVAVTSGLVNGTYVAYFSITSLIRGADAFEGPASIPFTVANVVPPPSPPIMSVVPNSGGYLVSWADPGGQAWDNDYVVAEVWRLDCVGNQRIATVPNGINGSYLDLAIPQLDPLTVQTEDGCEVQTEPCDITYSVRYWGYVSTSVELPDTIPAGMILGWPGTVGSIPSGWSRVTALDGYYPRGATGVGAPVITGGAVDHTHTTIGHTHQIAAHGHTLGGNTGTSNSSTTSARFNGASQPQADQPHSHARPNSVVSAGAVNSSSTAPGTSTVGNLPDTRTVIWINSNGAQPQYPVGILGWATESVSGWSDDASSSGRYLKGTVAAGNGGTNSGGATHTHTVNSHAHNGFNHGHSISSTGLSNPASSQEAGTGVSTPRWLPRHTHPMSVDSVSTGNPGSVSGGGTGSAAFEPLNRRLRTLVNTGGGTQTRVIGLYLGTVAALDPLLTLCNGGSGTPDMRGWFVRDIGSDSVNSTGGTSTHTHTTPQHAHVMPGHSHGTNVDESNTGSFERPTSGDLGDSPTTTHTHSSGNTANVAPSIASNHSGTTASADHTPTYHEAHFVRLDGTISGGPLPVPELKVSDYASVTVSSFTYDDGMDRLANFDTMLTVVTDRDHAYPRLSADSVPMDGGLHSISTTISGEDLSLTIGVEGLPAIDALEELLRSDRVYYSPLGGTPGWFAPSSWSVRAPAPTVKVLSITLVRQPWPPTADPQDYL